MEKDAKLALRISEFEKEKLAAAAKARNISTSQLIRELINNFFKEEK